MEIKLFRIIVRQHHKTLYTFNAIATNKKDALYVASRLLPKEIRQDPATKYIISTIKTYNRPPLCKIPY